MRLIQLMTVVFLAMLLSGCGGPSNSQIKEAVADYTVFSGEFVHYIKTLEDNYRNVKVDHYNVEDKITDGKYVFIKCKIVCKVICSDGRVDYTYWPKTFRFFRSDEGKWYLQERELQGLSSQSM